MNADPTIVIKGIEAVAELAGAPAPVVEVIGGATIDLIEWLESQFASGVADPHAALKALLTTADISAKAIEDAELG